MIDDINALKKDSLQAELQLEISDFIQKESTKFPEDEILKIDMHCHDYNSDVPDELLGRILNVPETWLKTDKLIKTLKENGSDVITITNHNNARSCFEQIKQGNDVLVGAEFSCMVPDFNVGIHVLAYGFNQQQEKILNKLRKDVYKFQRFAFMNNIPTVWAHPLYHYSTDGIPPMDFFNKTALIFERFEIMNGQRDTWQNMLTKLWLENLTPDKIEDYCQTYNIDPKLYCSNPYRKTFTGGSDSHMGIFAGQTGTYLHIPDLHNRLKTTSKSELALEAIRAGRTAVYGNHQNFEKLTVALLDYVLQIAINKQDPGLMRILLHKGTNRDKILALIISNVFSELKQHKVTMRFVELFHKCFIGKSPRLPQRLLVPKAYKTVFDDAIKISKINSQKASIRAKLFNENIDSISNKLNAILFKRLNTKLENLSKSNNFENIDINNFIEKFEIPSDIRTLLGKSNKASKDNDRMRTPNIGDFLDGLSFPFLASSIILGANFASAKVMYSNRKLLNTFSENLNRLKPRKRVLWLTDTYNDKNGVSMFLQDAHSEIKKRKLPIDILVCSNTVQADDNLLVLKPMTEFNLPFYNEQAIKIPNFLELHNLFLENEYDRIICSTEGVMGLAALYLKNAYTVSTHFYMHTDWMMFAKTVLKLENHNLSRVKRLLRAYYKAFDGIFVLNTDHQKWLTGTDIGIEKSKVTLTAHWVDQIFKPVAKSKVENFDIEENKPTIIFAGRLSEEKGLLEIPDLYTRIKESLPNIELVFAGTGPVENKLKELLPEAKFLGWVKHSNLPKIYSSADLLLLPSKFDTFSCVVLEAMSCGLPVVAYNQKGPKDIITHLKDGFLAETTADMERYILEYFSDTKLQSIMKANALIRSEFYQAEGILERFVEVLEV